MTIRRASDADRRRIWEIRFAVTENVLSDPSRVTEADVDWYQNDAILLVSESEAGDVAAFGGADHQTGYVWALFVDPAHEGKRHGSRLMAAMESGLAAAGHRQAFLTTGAGTRAERFYRARGWRDMGRAMDGQIVFVKALTRQD